MFRCLFDSTDPSRELHLVLFALAVLVAIGLTVANYREFDIVKYGEGIGALFAGCGACALGQGAQRKLQGSQPEDK